MRTRQALELGAYLRRQRSGVGIHLPDDFRDDALSLIEKREQQVLGEDLGMSLAIGELLGS